MSNKQSTIGPVSASKRIISLDVLRGFAVLGILIMNIQSFSMIDAAYLNPTAYGDLTGINKWVWILSYLLADQKFITIFSMLFGAGILLMTGRAESKGLKPAPLHYRRTLWLLLIGFIHAYGLWTGDILFPYAVCALIAYAFRKLSPKILFFIGLGIFSVSSIIYLLFGFTISFWPPEAVKGIMEGWKPALETIEHELAAYRGNWLAQMTHRVPSSLMFQTFIFMIWTGWRVGGSILIGMALYKWGVLSAEKSKKFYWIMATLCLVIGLPIVAFGIVSNFAAGWKLEYSMFLGSQFNYWGSLLIALGYISLIMLIVKSGICKWISNRLAATGRMALTNYLAQTLICTTLFYGHGFGLYGKVERIGQIGIVLAVWIVQLICSPIWLHYFQFGPAEWLWRSLTYKKRQPMLIK